MSRYRLVLSRAAGDSRGTVRAAAASARSHASMHRHRCGCLIERHGRGWLARPMCAWRSLMTRARRLKSRPSWRARDDPLPRERHGRPAGGTACGDCAPSGAGLAPAVGGAFFTLRRVTAEGANTRQLGALGLRAGRRGAGAARRSWRRPAGAGACGNDPRRRSMGSGRMLGVEERADRGKGLRLAADP